MIYSTEVVQAARDRQSVGFIWSDAEATKYTRRQMLHLTLECPSFDKYSMDWSSHDDIQTITPRVHDIWHDIIAYLENDRDSLQALCLVDRTMNQLASKFLWRNVHLRTKPHRFSRFRDAIFALMNDKKSYAAYVRRLRIFSPTTSSFGRKERNPDRKNDYYRDVCERFRSNIVDVLPRLRYLESFEWATTLHFNKDILVALSRHSSIKNIDICPGSEQTWTSLKGLITPFSLLSLQSLNSLSLTIPNIFADQYDPPTSKITKSLWQAIPSLQNLNILSLRFTPLPTLSDEEMYALYAFPPAVQQDELPQSELESMLFKEIHKLSRKNKGFKLKMAGMDFSTMWSFIHRHHPITNISSLTVLDNPSNGVIYTNPKGTDGDNTMYDYEYHSSGKLVVRDCSVLQVILLKMYRDQLETLDIECPNAAVELVALPNLKRLRTGICISNGIDWDIEMVNKIAIRCENMEKLELLIPWDWKWWRMCWVRLRKLTSPYFLRMSSLILEQRRRNDPSFVGMLVGYDKLTTLEVSVERYGRRGGTYDQRDDLRDAWKQRQRWLKDMLPSDAFIPYLLQTYPSLTSIKVGSQAATALHQGVRKDAARFEAALCAFKIIPRDDPMAAWSPVQGLFN